MIAGNTTHYAHCHHLHPECRHHHHRLPQRILPCHHLPPPPLPPPPSQVLVPCQGIILPLPGTSTSRMLTSWSHVYASIKRNKSELHPMDCNKRTIVLMQMCKLSTFLFTLLRRRSMSMFSSPCDCTKRLISDVPVPDEWIGVFWLSTSESGKTSIKLGARPQNLQVKLPRQFSQRRNVERSLRREHSSLEQMNLSEASA